MKKISTIMIAAFLGLQAIVSHAMSQPIKNENSFSKRFTQTMTVTKEFVHANSKTLLIGVLGVIGMGSGGVGLWCWLQKSGKQLAKNKKDQDIKSGTGKEPTNGSMITNHVAGGELQGVKTLQRSIKLQAIDTGVGITKEDLEPELSENDIFEGGECGTMINDRKKPQVEAQEGLKANIDHMDEKKPQRRMGLGKGTQPIEEKIETPDAQAFKELLVRTEMNFDLDLIAKYQIELQKIDDQDTLCYNPQGMKVAEEEVLHRIFERWALNNNHRNGSVNIRMYNPNGTYSQSTLKLAIYGQPTEEMQRQASFEKTKQGFYEKVMHWGRSYLF
jgi:hypothetical protein